MPSPAYQYVINLVVSLPIRTGTDVFMNVSMWEHGALNNQSFLCGNVYFSNTIISTILMRTLILNCRFEDILSSQFFIKISQLNFHTVLTNMIENLLKTLLNHHFSSQLMHAHSKNGITPVNSQNYI